jgi:hypothetical protein
MYEIWSIRPANMGASFDSIHEVEAVIRATVEEYGLEQFTNLALFMYADCNDQRGNCIAEGEEILAEVTRQRHC